MSKLRPNVHTFALRLTEIFQELQIRQLVCHLIQIEQLIRVQEEHAQIAQHAKTILDRLNVIVVQIDFGQ